MSKRITTTLAAAVLLTGCGSTAHKTSTHATVDSKLSPQAQRDLGQGIETRLQAGWNQYKIQDEPTMAGQLGSAIKLEPTLVQVSATEHAFLFAGELALQQRLMTGDDQKLVAAMEARFPATRDLLTKEVASNVAAAARNRRSSQLKLLERALSFAWLRYHAMKEAMAAFAESGQISRSLVT